MSTTALTFGEKFPNALERKFLVRRSQELIASGAIGLAASNCSAR
jgi:hypothetical protein